MSRRRSISLDAATPRDRVLLLLDLLFEGNQTRMAEGLGVSQAAVAKIVGGTRNPGMRFLRALSQHPRVNPAWLFQGEGEPLLAERTTTPEGGWPVPVFESLLPGPPKLKAPVSGQLVLVPGAIYRPTLYFFRVTSVSLSMLAADEHVIEGDQILLETDSTLWRANTRMLDGRLCAIARHAGDAGDVDHIELQRVRCVVDHDGHRLELINVSRSIALSEMDRLFIERHGRGPRPVQVGNQDDVPVPIIPADAPSAAVAPEWETLPIADVLAVAIKLYRDL